MSNDQQTADEVTTRILAELTETARKYNSLSKGMALIATTPEGRERLENALCLFKRWQPVMATASRELSSAIANTERALRKRKWSLKA